RRRRRDPSRWLPPRARSPRVRPPPPELRGRPPPGPPGTVEAQGSRDRARWKGGMRVGRSLMLCAAALCLVAATAPPVRAGPVPARTELGPMDWPTYGHDLHRPFAGRTTLAPNSVTTLPRAWFFPT